jgi:hypothetical protein
LDDTNALANRMAGIDNVDKRKALQPAAKA